MLNKNKDQAKKIQELEDELKVANAALGELMVLNEIAIAAGRAVNIDETLDSIIKTVLKAVNAEQGYIHLISGQNDIFKTLIRKDQEGKLKQRYNISKSVTGWILLNKQPLLVEDFAADERFFAEEKRKDIHSIICAPIWFEGEIIGIISMINKNNPGGKFNDDELRLLSIISVQAGQLIKNSQMQQETLLKTKEAEIARIEALKLQELDKLKTNFFNNISHEFRTPLTLILGPIEKIINNSTNEKIVKEAKIVKQNSSRLLQLINQLLDLSRLEAGKLNLEAAKGNIVSFVKGIVLSFESLAEDKDISLRFLPKKDSLEVYFDSDKIMKILTNLLSNAFKFTPEDGEITVTIREIEFSGKVGVEIKVKDTGIGIPENELQNLFNRFYQVENSFTKEYGGTGIGLALAKELVELHHGDISVKSKSGEGTEFIIILPAGSDHLKDSEIVEQKESNIKVFVNENHHSSTETEDIKDNVPINKTIILLVEDNFDMRRYIKDSLQEIYHVEEALSGEQGLRKSQKIIPDLIISDMMMPGMDGNELTKILKNDERTSHIPIILLTAKSGFENKLEGLKTGADEYLTKPFDIRELKIRIENLINIRRKLHEKYKKEGLTLKSTGPVSLNLKNSLRRIDAQFMEKVLSVAQENLSDEDFSIENFGSEVGMSRTQLHRKLKALTGKSPSLYLRSLRLERAKKMIEEDQGNISEIAYSVGFSSPAYFTSCFKEEFGCLPSDLLS